MPITKQRAEYEAGLLEDYAAGLAGDWIMSPEETPEFISDLRMIATTIRALSVNLEK